MPSPAGWVLITAILHSTAYSQLSPQSLEQLRVGDANFAQGRFREALDAHLAVLRQHPTVPEHHYRAGLDYSRLKALDAAEAHFREAVRLNPDYAHAHGALADVLLLTGRVADATAHARRAVELSPDEPELAIGLAWVLEADRQSRQAAEIAHALLDRGYESNRLAVLCAALAPRLNRAADAVERLERRLAQTPAPPGHEASAMHFAAAGLLDGMGRYDDAFKHASRANTLRGVQYDPSVVERLVTNFVAYFTRPALRDLPRATHKDRSPVFIVGMPRSGTTLVEQILASHPAVHGAGEIGWVYRLWESAVKRRSTPVARLTDCLDGITSQDANELAAGYLNPLHALAPSASRITDKTTANVMHLGLIAVLFPEAKIIHCRRDPRDTCLSCFMTDFTAGNHFSVDLLSAGHFYLQNERMMDHWKSVLDVPILEVEYEHLVQDLEPQARRMVEHLGLPWDDNCLRFNENPRFVATASNAQVRQPLYQKSAGRWRNYARQLEPLQKMLQGG